jgi:hypothetical protein
MLNVSTRPRRRNAGRPPEKSARQFLQWLRGRECVFYFMGGCAGKSEAMHLDFAGGKGVSTKVADKYALPACTAHHRLQHDKGWNTFCGLAATTKPALLQTAEFLWSRWPGRVRWEAENG